MSQRDGGVNVAAAAKSLHPGSLGRRLGRKTPRGRRRFAWKGLARGRSSSSPFSDFKHRGSCPRIHVIYGVGGAGDGGGNYEV